MKTYTSPQVEIIELEIEDAVLSNSVFGNDNGFSIGIDDDFLYGGELG